MARFLGDRPVALGRLAVASHVVGLLALLAGWVLVVVFWDSRGDWLAYYRAARNLDLAYDMPLNTFGAYLYSPAFAQALWAPAVVSTPHMFFAGFAALNVGALYYLAGPIFGPLAMLFVPIQGELTHGNIHLLMAAAVAFGFRAPATWAFIILTKASPAMALAWFVLRRRWRALVWVAGSTALIVLVSLALDADSWVSWVTSLADNTSVDSLKAILPWPRWLRWGIGLAFAVAGALLGLRWAVVVAAMFTVPIFWAATITMLLGTLPLATVARRESEVRG